MREQDYVDAAGAQLSDDDARKSSFPRAFVAVVVHCASIR